MKKLLLAIFLLAAAHFVCAQNVEIPDTAFLYALIEEGVDKNGDSLISYTEAEVITSLDISGGTSTPWGKTGNGNVQSLSGIDAFSNLDTLHCNRNSIDSLNLTNNKNLTYLDCANNQLTYLNVSGNTELEFLHCSSGQQLQSLDLSNNSLLKELICENNELSSLDLSANPALTYLSIRNNNLVNLDVSNNDSLVFLNCERNGLTTLNCSNNAALIELNVTNNELTSLDISNCTALTVLEASFNNLTSLDISANNALVLLGIVDNELTSLNVSNHTSLETVYCDNNNLTTLDLSNCTALLALGCRSNKMTHLDVTNCTALEDLVCEENQLTDLDVSTNIALDGFDFKDNDITSLDISNNTSLGFLCADNNSLTSLDLSKNIDLIMLECSNNALTQLDLSKNINLRTLECSNNALTQLDVSNNSKLWKLDISLMPTLYEVCVWTSSFPPEGLNLEINGSPNICFNTFCDGICPQEPAWKLMNNQCPGGYTCIVDSLIYSFAGGREHWAMWPIEDTVNSINTVYNTVTNEKNALPDMPLRMTVGGIGLVEDKIYLVGGWMTPNPGDWITTDSILEFNTETSTFTFKEKCPKKIGSSVSCVMDNKIYLFGGWGDPFLDVSHPYDALIYDPVNEIWDSLPDMLHPHLMHGTAEVLDGNIYVIGGVGPEPDFTPQRSEKFDGEKWESIAEMPVPVSLHKSIVHDNKILVFGGDSIWTTDKSYSINLIQEYDPATDSWRLMKPMPFQRSAMTGGKVGNYVYLMGGWTDDRDPYSFVSEVWRFNLDSAKVLESSEIPVHPADRINLYPNPSDDIINITFENIHGATIELYDVNGRLVLNKAVNSTVEKIDVSGLPEGMYVVKVKQYDNIYVGKFAVR